jgi:hypothetical protein
MDTVSLLMAVILGGALQRAFLGLRSRTYRKLLIREDKPAKEITLSEFVDGNAKLMTAVGVFVALTGFSTSLQIKPLGNILSFLSLLTAITLFVELWRVSIRGFKTPLLYWFLELLGLILTVLTVYWLVQFRSVVEVAIRPAQYVIISFLAFHLFWSCPLLKIHWQRQPHATSQQSLVLSAPKWYFLLAVTFLLYYFADPIELWIKALLGMLAGYIQSL